MEDEFRTFLNKYCGLIYDCKINMNDKVRLDMPPLKSRSKEVNKLTYRGAYMRFSDLYLLFISGVFRVEYTKKEKPNV